MHAGSSWHCCCCCDRVAFVPACLHRADLFAPGHIVTDRAKSSADILANDKASNTDFPVWQSTVLNTAPLGAALTPVPHPLQDAAYVSPGTYSMIAKSEESLHTDFNEGGAIVRNLKTLLKVRKNSVQNDKKQIIEDYLKHFGNLHDDITTGVVSPCTSALLTKASVHHLS